MVLLQSACDSGEWGVWGPALTQTVRVRLSNSRNSSELLKVTLATLGRPIQISLSLFFHRARQCGLSQTTGISS